MTYVDGLPLKRSLPTRDDGEGKRSRTRKRLIDAALRLMSERGIVATSVSEISAAADVANGTFYLHFRNKPEIVSVICQSVTLAMHTEMDSKRVHVLDGAARVLFATRQFIEIAADEPVWGNLLLRAVAESNAIKNDLSLYMRADVDAGIKQGLFRSDCDEFVIDCLLAILTTGISARLTSGDREVSLRAGEFMLGVLGMSRDDVDAHARQFRKDHPARPTAKRRTQAVPAPVRQRCAPASGRGRGQNG